MIFDRLEYADRYAGLTPALAAALDFLSSADLAGMPEGRHSIDGDRVYAVLREYTTRPPDEGRWEAHRRYGDVQLVVRGAERMGFAPLMSMACTVPYDAENDVAFFSGQGDVLTVREGAMAIFFPHDAHMPELCLDAPALVRKIVVKFELTA